MDPFNIKIEQDAQIITLTICAEEDYYKIIYYGGIIGAIKKTGSKWTLLPNEKIIPGDLPLYDFKKSYGEDHVKLELNSKVIAKVAKEIEQSVA